MATENGSALKIKIGATYGSSKFVDSQTAGSQSNSSATRDTTNKFNNGDQSLEYGLREGSLSLTCNYDPAAETANTNFTYEDFLDAWLARTKLVCHFTTGVSGSVLLTGTYLVTSVNLDAPMEDNATFTVDLSRSGALTKTTVA